MPHHRGSPLVVVPTPVVRMERLIRLTARLVARMLPPPPTGPPPGVEIEHEEGIDDGSTASRGCTHGTGDSR
jgi:hypothetical protein